MLPLFLPKYSKSHKENLKLATGMARNVRHISWMQGKKVNT